jgi:Zn-dependent protease
VISLSVAAGLLLLLAGLVTMVAGAMVLHNARLLATANSRVGLATTDRLTDIVLVVATATIVAGLAMSEIGAEVAFKAGS